MPLIPTHLTATVTVFVLGAGVLHAAWNAIASVIEDKLLAFGLIGLTQTIVAAICLPITGLPRSSAFAYVVASALIHVAYTYALLHSYRLGDFGRAYPLARGTSPLLVAVGAWFLADEHLAAIQIAGISIVAAGLIAIVFAGGRLTRADVPATLAAMITGVTIAAYTVLDGLASAMPTTRSATPPCCSCCRAPSSLPSRASHCAVSAPKSRCPTLPPGSRRAPCHWSPTAS